MILVDLLLHVGSSSYIHGDNKTSLPAKSIPSPKMYFQIFQMASSSFNILIFFFE